MSSLTTITSDFLRQMQLPHPGEGDKKARGNVLVIAGGAEVPGSAFLAGIGALRAGAGRLQIATCARNATALGIAVPEALVLGVPETPAGAIDPIAAVQLMPYVERADVVLLGPGCQTKRASPPLPSQCSKRYGRAPPSFSTPVRSGTYARRKAFSSVIKDASSSHRTQGRWPALWDWRETTSRPNRSVPHVKPPPNCIRSWR